MGSRFDPAGETAEQPAKDPDRRMWDALDTGEDPTAR
jgi:Tryptophan-associated transmembrane protein (Trp_oprn_chp)